MKISRSVELEEGGQILTEVKIQKGIFQSYPLLPLLLAMMLMNYKLKYKGSYKFTKSREKTKYLMNMNDIKIFASNEIEQEILLQTIRIWNYKNLLSKMCNAYNKKEKKETRIVNIV